MTMPVTGAAVLRRSQTTEDDAGSAPGRAARRGDGVLGVLDDHLDPPFMEELVARMRAGMPGADIRVWIKPLGTAPAPDDVILEMAEEVRLALVGVGL